MIAMSLSKELPSARRTHLSIVSEFRVIGSEYAFWKSLSSFTKTCHPVVRSNRGAPGWLEDDVVTDIAVWVAQLYVSVLGADVEKWVRLEKADPETGTLNDQLNSVKTWPGSVRSGTSGFAPIGLSRTAALCEAPLRASVRSSSPRSLHLNKKS